MARNDHTVEAETDLLHERRMSKEIEHLRRENQRLQAELNALNLAQLNATERTLTSILTTFATIDAAS